MEAKGDEWASRPIAPQYISRTYYQCLGTTVDLLLCHCWYYIPNKSQASGICCKRRNSLNVVALKPAIFVNFKNDHEYGF